MRGSIRQRYGGASWVLIFDRGYEVDATGKRRRKQRWVTFHPTPGLSVRDQRTQAEAKLVELLAAVNTGTFSEPSKVTLIEWLRTWLDKSIKPPMRRPATYRSYRTIIETHIAPHTIALIPLQRLRSSHLERYLADVPGAAGSLAVHHALLHRALRRAVKDRLLTVSPATDLERRRVTTDPAQEARVHCWTAQEAARFLDAARTACGQVMAFYFLALDSGARKSELAGLGWEHLDLDAGTLTISRQLDSAGVEPVFGPTKTKRARTLSLGPETIAALRVHRQAQAELKMRNRPTYVDFGLIFAKEDANLQRPGARLGHPIATLAEAGTFGRLITQAGVRKIKFHGLRHTCATLLLQAGVRPHDVASRLGHSVLMLMTTYAHALPSAQQDAAARLGDLLHKGRA